VFRISRVCGGGGEVRPAIALAVSAAAVLVVGSGYAVADVQDVVPGVLTRDVAPAPLAPGVLPTPAESPAPLETTSADAPEPMPAALAAQVGPALASPSLGESVGVDVRDARTGKVLLAQDPDTPRTPASTAKLITAAAVVSGLDPMATMATSVVQESDRTIALVAAGDTMLAAGKGRPRAVEGRAGLSDLAVQVARRLRAAGTTSVRLRLDTSYAAGPAYAPTWNQADVAAGFTQGVFMIGLAGQRPTPLKPSPPDPALQVAQAFQRALRARGVAASLEPEAGWGTAVRDGARVLGQVRSAPIGEVLALALAESDNALTENLARQLAVHLQRPATFAAAAQAVRDSVRHLGVDLGAAHLVDSCGLSAGQTLPVHVLGDVLALATSGRLPAMRGVVASLPVAGLDGTLEDRFRTDPAEAAAGLARAKTGTLTGVSALAGTVVDRSGRLLSFAVIADQVPGGPAGTLPARAALDRFVAALATCGCR
jgi:D-alanyl-D-alanine carboxypeptidase/D-alanyl-D-alanine-endopeptidase (penicillin-binding protein 4)